MKKRSFVLKIAITLLAFAPVAAVNARSLFIMAGEPQLPAKLNHLGEDTH